MNGPWSNPARRSPASTLDEKGNNTTQSVTKSGNARRMQQSVCSFGSSVDYKAAQLPEGLAAGANPSPIVNSQHGAESQVMAQCFAVSSTQSQAQGAADEVDFKSRGTLIIGSSLLGSAVQPQELRGASPARHAACNVFVFASIVPHLFAYGKHARAPPPVAAQRDVGFTSLRTGSVTNSPSNPPNQATMELRRCTAIQSTGQAGGCLWGQRAGRRAMKQHEARKLGQAARKEAGQAGRRFAARSIPSAHVHHIRTHSGDCVATVSRIGRQADWLAGTVVINALTDTYASRFDATGLWLLLLLSEDAVLTHGLVSVLLTPPDSFCPLGLPEIEARSRKRDVSVSSFKRLEDTDELQLEPAKQL
ncbi:hypothetical protein BC567DRAFT_248304 [Phyllosticta citribraziliensis]